MIDEVIVIGDLKRRNDASVAEYDRLGERMYAIVSGLPGFQSVKSFKAADGEELTVFRFASEEALEAWRTHPEHVETMKRGHAEILHQRFPANLQGHPRSRPIRSRVRRPIRSSRCFRR